MLAKSHFLAHLSILYFVANFCENCLIYSVSAWSFIEGFKSY